MNILSCCSKPTSKRPQNISFCVPFKLCIPLLPVAAVPARLPQPCSIRFLVEQFLDISAVPRRSFFEVLATFATNELERDKLLEFSSAQGQDALHSYCNRPRRTAREVREHLNLSLSLALPSTCSLNQGSPQRSDPYNRFGTCFFRDHLTVDER